MTRPVILPDRRSVSAFDLGMVTPNQELQLTTISGKKLMVSVLRSAKETIAGDRVCFGPIEVWDTDDILMWLMMKCPSRIITVGKPWQFGEDEQLTHHVSEIIVLTFPR